MNDLKSNTRPFLTTKQAAIFLAEKNGIPIAPRTLTKLRVIGGGPTFRRFGRLVIYDCNDLLDWATGRISGPLASTSTSVTRLIP
jgi:hypothetical protein